MKKFKYRYNATCTAVHDGDTITVDIDLGFDMQLSNMKIRMYGINAPELKDPTKAAGIASRDYLISRIKGQQIVVETIRDKKEKYGRYLAKVFLPDGSDINKEMIDKLFAIKFMV